MRRTAVVVLSMLLVGAIGIGGDLPGWSSDGTTSYSSSIVVQNVSDTVAVVNVVYQTSCDPTTPDVQMTVPAGTTQAQYVNDVNASPWGASAIVSSDVPIIATQNFLTADPNGGTQWASHSGGVTAPSTTWYLAEGSTYGGFQSTIAVQNPNASPASVAITYTQFGSPINGPSMTVSPFGQSQVAIVDTLVDYSSIGVIVTADVPVIAQMTTYWSGGAASTSTMGVPAPSTTWYLAEGNTASWSGFETWVTVQNPSPTTAEVQVQFIGDGTQQAGPTFSVAPMSHDTFNAADSFPEHAHFSTVVTSDTPIVAVQSKRWDHEQGYDGTMGVTAPSSQWYFPVAQTHTGASSWIALQNVGTSSTTVSVEYMPQGTAGTETVTLDPFGHEMISIPDIGQSPGPIAVVVNSAQPILALQGSYWETGSGTYQDTAFGIQNPSTIWYLPQTPQPMSQLGPSGDTGTSASDRDGDGVPDDTDYCPDFPGSPATNGC